MSGGTEGLVEVLDVVDITYSPSRDAKNEGRGRGSLGSVEEETFISDASGQ